MLFYFLIPLKKLKQKYSQSQIFTSIFLYYLILPEFHRLKNTKNEKFYLV